MSALDERTHRVVARLRADEVEHLEHETRGFRGNANGDCPHLPLFHNHGNTTQGGTWASCMVRGCEHVSEEPPNRLDVLMRKQDAAQARADLHARYFVLFFLGVLIGIVGFWVGTWWIA